MVHADAQPTAAGLCAGEDHGDPIARGYVTVDVVDECSGIRLEVWTPADSLYPYFSNAGGTRIGIVSNVG
jgi:hypothetical protein